MYFLYIKNTFTNFITDIIIPILSLSLLDKQTNEFTLVYKNFAT